MMLLKSLVVFKLSVIVISFYRDYASCYAHLGQIKDAVEVLERPLIYLGGLK